MREVDFAGRQPQTLDDVGMVYDRHTQQLIKYNRFMTASEVAKRFNCTKGQLLKQSRRGYFPKPTQYRPGNVPVWADTLIDRITRRDD